MRKLSVSEVHTLIKPNKLRQYPSPKKGAKRLQPFAQVNMRQGLSVPTDATFFAIGSCFSRHYEKALEFGGFPVLSSSKDTDLPSPPESVPRWFNKFTVDAALNELRWSLEGDAGDRGASSLVEFGDEYGDMQLGWAFAHKETEAVRYRRSYNAAFDGVRTADVIIVATGNTENWFDTEQGIYLNSMIPNQVADSYPGRFELHYFEFEEAYASLQRLYDTVMTRPGPKPLLLLSVSAVAQPTTCSLDDAMVMNFALQATQRAAVEQFVNDHPDDVGYIPSFEAFMLSDRKYAFMETTFNHGRQECMDRVVSNLLITLQGESEGQSLINVRGMVESYLTADLPDEAAKVVRAHLDQYGEHPNLDLIAANVARVTGNKQDAFIRYERAALNDDITSLSLMSTAFNLGLQVGETERAKHLLARMEDAGANEEGLDKLRKKLSGPVSAPAAQDVNPGDDRAALSDLCELLLGKDPAKLIDTLEQQKAEGTALDDKQRWYYARALIKVDTSKAITYLDELIQSDFQYAKSASKTRYNLLRNRKDVPADVLLAAEKDYEARLAG